MIDLHCHILPGVDHGAQSVEESIEMLSAAAKEGITHIIATPHAYDKDLDISRAQEACALLKPLAEKVNIKLKMGFECNVKAIDVNNFEAARRFCIEGTNSLLLEFPFEHWPRHWRDIVYSLQAYGMSIVIAHPERLVPIQHDLSIIDKLADMGCSFQINAESARRIFGSKVKVVKYLRDQKLIHFMASDAHTAEDYKNYQKTINKYSHDVQYIHAEF